MLPRVAAGHRRLKTGSVTMPSSDQLEKALGRRDIVLFTVSAVLALDTLAATASIGPSGVFWWLVIGVFFLAPMGLIFAEMSAAYPAEGGVYAWIKQGLGRNWAARAVWAYWINVAIWIPSIFVLVAGMASELLSLDMPLPAQVAIGVALAWIVVGLDIAGLSIGKWAPNIGAALKILIFLVLIIGGWRYGAEHGFANDLSLASMAPRVEEGLRYVPAIAYGMLGLELVNNAGGDIRRPERDAPAALLVSAALILCLYLFATVGLLAATPAGDIDIVDGLIHTLRLLFADAPGGGLIAALLGLAALFVFFSIAATWAMGSNRTIAEAARDGEFPAFLGVRGARRGGPVGAAISMGIVCSTVLVLYGALSRSIGDLFWSLFSFSTVIFMLPYIAAFAAFVALRVKDRRATRPFRAPGGFAGACVLAGLCIATLAFSIALFLVDPVEGVQSATVIGVVCALLIGEGLIRWAETTRRP
jgi:amino acid transporter